MKKYKFLSRKEAREIRALAEEGSARREEIANAYDVSINTVYRIIEGSWKPKVKNQRRHANRVNKQAPAPACKVVPYDEVAEMVDKLVKEAMGKPWWRFWA